MTDRLVDFVGILREYGITAGPSETIDAAEAILALGLTDTNRLRSGLAATLLRRNGQRAVFDQLFDLYFLGIGEIETHELESLEAMREHMVSVLARDDSTATTELARRTLTMLGGYGGAGAGQNPSPVSTGSGMGWSSYQTMKTLRPEELVDRIAETMGGTSRLDTAVHTIEARRRVDAFRAAVRTEAMLRAGQLRGTDYIARRGVEAATDRVDFLGAREQDLAEMRRLVTPLARKLATRLAARRRKAVRGHIDMRRTLRRSMATGGVPIDPVLRSRKHGRPDLVILADLSGSVTASPNSPSTSSKPSKTSSPESAASVLSTPATRSPPTSPPARHPPPASPPESSARPTSLASAAAITAKPFAPSPTTTSTSSAPAPPC